MWSGGLHIVKTGGTILTGYGGGGGRVPMGRRRGKMSGDHERQNKQTEEVARQLGLSKGQQRELHDLVHNQGMGFQEILEFAQQWFKK